MDDTVNKRVAFEVRVLAQERIHLLDMCDTLQIPDDKTRYMRLGRFALQNRSYVKLKGHY